MAIGMCAGTDILTRASMLRAVYEQRETTVSSKFACHVSALSGKSLSHHFVLYHDILF